MRTSLTFVLFLGIVLQVGSRTDMDFITPLPISEGFQIFGGSAGGSIGSLVSSAGDINKDGVDDIIMGLPDRGPGTNGIVYLFYGKSGGFTENFGGGPLSASDGFYIVAEPGGGDLGKAVGRAGDFNGDGIDDMLFSDPVFDGSNPDVGAVYIIYGKTGGFTNIVLSSSLSTSDGFRILGKVASYNLGSALGFAGDFNNDHIDDIIIGVPSGNSGAGEAYVIYGKLGGYSAHLDLASGLPPLTGLRITGKNANDNLGCAVSRAGDINHDGIMDIIIGIRNGDSPSSSDLGSALIIYGKTGGYPSPIDLSSPLPISTGFQILGGVGNIDVGYSVSFAGDVNGDEIDDCIIGDYLAAIPSRTNAGADYIIYGKVGGYTADIDLNLLSLSQGVRIIGIASDGLGKYVSSAGDFNGDGIDDILIGAQAASRKSGRSNNGAAYVIYGQAGGFTQHIDLNTILSSTFRFEMIGAVTTDLFGTSVSLLGDMNGDGVKDIVVGIPGSDIVLSNAGAAAIIYADSPQCPIIPHCMSCPMLKCLVCQYNYRVYPGDGKCYHKNSCPSGTSANSTHCCVDNLLKSIAITQSITSKSAVLVASAISLFSFNNPVALIFAALGESLLYMKYMTITFPPRLQGILDEPGSELYTIQYITSAPEEIEDKIPNFPLADNFERNDIDSSFLINFWSPLMTLLMVAVAIVIVCLGAYITKSCQSVNSAIKNIKESLKWNYLISTFSGCYGPVAFFSSFEFRTFQFESFLEILSLAICVLMNVALLTISVKQLMITKTLSLEKNPKKLERIKRQLVDYQIAFESFKSNSWSQLSYFVISCIRMYLFYVILGYLFEHPLTQAILINIQGLIFLGYLCLKRPFESKFDLVESFILELIFQVIHGCVLVLVILDQKDLENSDDATRTGNVIIVFICLFVAFQCLYLLIQVLKLLISLFKYLRNTFCLDKKEQAASRRKKALRTSSNDLSIYMTGINEDSDISTSRVLKKKSMLRPLEKAVIRGRAEMKPEANAIDHKVPERYNNDPRSIVSRHKIVENRERSSSPTEKPKMAAKLSHEKINPFNFQNRVVMNSIRRHMRNFKS